MKVVKEVNPSFEDFIFDWDKKFYFLVGGYGSSKSYHIALKIILKLTQEKRTCLVVREVFETIRESCFSLFYEICDSLNLEDYVIFTKSPMQILFKNGSRIIFRGLDKPAKLKSINDISLIWIEECSEIKYAAFKELIGRLRNPHLKLYMLLSTNPVSTSNWCYKHFFELAKLDDNELYAKKIICRNDVYYHHSTVDDNLFLPDDYRQRLDEMQEYDPDLYRIARLGRFGVNGVRVLPQFEIMTHAEVMKVVDNIPRKFKFVGMDFGFVTSYNSCIRCAVDDANKHLYIYWNWYEKGLTDDQIVDRLTEFVKTREIVRCDSAEPKTIRYLQKNGINAIGCKKFAGSRLYNIRKIKRFKKIICSDACENVIKELAELTFAKDRNDNLIEDEFNIDAHCFDALAYAIETYDVVDLKYKFDKADLGL